VTNCCGKCGRENGMWRRIEGVEVARRTSRVAGRHRREQVERVATCIGGECTQPAGSTIQLPSKRTI
jgi:hypothetical protein